jgi:uncharacterized iron-regulated membrane protein
MPGSGFLHKPRQVNWRNWSFQIHLWLGLIIGLVVGLVGLTGAAVVFRVEMNRMTTPGTAYVEPAGERVPVDRMLEVLQKDRPNDRLQYVYFDAGPAYAWNFRTQSPEDHRIHTYVDQYRAQIVGQENYHGKFLQWLYDLHADLLLGKPGRTANGFVALTLIILSLTGIVIWWPGLKLWRNGFRYETRANWKRQNYDLHKLAGFWSSAMLLILSVTGAYFSFPDQYKAAAAWLTGTEVITDPPKAQSLWAARAIPVEQYIRTAEQAMPGARAIHVGFPQKEGEPVSLRMKEANDWHRVGLSWVYLEPATGAVLRVDRLRDMPLATKLIRWMTPFHFGRFGERFGAGDWLRVVILVLYLIFGLAPPLLLLTGVLMYWNRVLSKKRARAPLARPVLSSGD